MAPVRHVVFGQNGSSPFSWSSPPSARGVSGISYGLGTQKTCPSCAAFQPCNTDKSPDQSLNFLCFEMRIQSVHQTCIECL